MKKDSRIYIAGHTGLVGSALYRKLVADGYTNLITRSHAELDLEPGLSKEDLLEAIKGHILAEGQLMGTYQR